MLKTPAHYILANILSLFLSFVLNTTIIGVTFSHVISAFDSNFSLLRYSSSSASSRFALGNVIWDQKY